MRCSLTKVLDLTAEATILSIAAGAFAVAWGRAWTHFTHHELGYLSSLGFAKQLVLLVTVQTFAYEMFKHLTKPSNSDSNDTFLRKRFSDLSCISIGFAAALLAINYAPSPVFYVIPLAVTIYGIGRLIYQIKTSSPANV